MPGADTSFHRTFGGVPEPDLPYVRALRWAPRADDPNAGRYPCDPNSGQPTDYQQPFVWVAQPRAEDSYQEHAWIKDHKPNHIGGTMQPVQWVPSYSPFYVEFEEYLGGYNFGGGNAQLDFRDMRFDWACG